MKQIYGRKRLLSYIEGLSQDISTAAMEDITSAQPGM